MFTRISLCVSPASGSSLTGGIRCSNVCACKTMFPCLSALGMSNCWFLPLCPVSTICWTCIRSESLSSPMVLSGSNGWPSLGDARYIFPISSSSSGGSVSSSKGSSLAVSEKHSLGSFDIAGFHSPPSCCHRFHPSVVMDARPLLFPLKKARENVVQVIGLRRMQETMPQGTNHNCSPTILRRSIIIVISSYGT